MVFSICYWANYTQGKTKFSCKSENDNIVPFENDTPINQNEKVRIKERRSGWSD